MASNKRKISKLALDDLLQLDKRVLAQKIIQLEAHNLQLKNVISKSNSAPEKVEKQKKPYDFSKCNFRRVLLRVAYFGWDYQGLAVQEDSPQTIEHYLFQALIKTCLIENRENSQYHRCGRTDKGVSAFGQVISISLRSKYSASVHDSLDNVKDEIPYCKMLNRLLPKDIRVLAWMPIPQDETDFSARFNCKSRIYRYYFPRGNLDLIAMKTAAVLLVGSHDFRNLCKMDVANGVVEYVRNIKRTDIVPMDASDSDKATSMYYFEIEGNAFLWHQIRCIMGVLILIGQGKEPPEVIEQLLDIQKNPCKPQYSMALDLPLNLYYCEYNLQGSGWIYDKDELQIVLNEIKNQWTLYNIKSTMIKDCLCDLETELNKLTSVEELNGDCKVKEKDGYTDHLLQGVKSKVYCQLLKRDMCSSLEDRIEHYKKKRTLTESDDVEKMEPMS